MSKAMKSRRTLILAGSQLTALIAAGAAFVPGIAAAQTDAWVGPAWAQAQEVPLPANVATGPMPATIPQYQELADGSGLIASFQPGGATDVSTSAFFAPLGTNGRTCFSCHLPQNDWSITPDTVRSIFNTTLGTDPLFAAVDGADCPDLVADESATAATCPEDGDDALEQFVAARQQLFTRGNFRIFIPVPTSPPPQWKVHVVHDPYGCEGSATYGLPRGILSMYRRPLPSSNTFDLDPGGRLDANGDPAFNIMWDAREPDLITQFKDATLVHAQAAGPPTDEQQREGAAFQDGLFTGQVYDNLAGDLTAAGALGGPKYIATLPPGLNTVAPGPPPTRPGPTFVLFDTWVAAQALAARQSIKRGEDIFNGTSRTFYIRNVAGLNDLPGLPNPVQGSCSFCHNSGDRGNDFFLDPKHLGIGDNSSTALPPTRDLPLLGFLCPVGSIPFFSNPVKRGGVTYDEFFTTDPGVGLITGQCADLGKMKVPVLRGIAGRAPYFHGGEAATLFSVVDFYDRRFDIHFSSQERSDLVHFLRSL